MLLPLVLVGATRLDVVVGGMVALGCGCCRAGMVVVVVLGWCWQHVLFFAGVGGVGDATRWDAVLAVFCGMPRSLFGRRAGTPCSSRGGGRRQCPWDAAFELLCVVAAGGCLVVATMVVVVLL
jgi:hypothetical protein